MAVDAVILAGALAEPEMQPEGKEISRAMVRVGGKTMLQWIVDAMVESAAVGRIVAVGHVEADGIDQTLDPLDTFLDNVMMGVEAASGDRILMSSSDIPLVSAAAIDDFVQRALTADAGFCFPIIRKEDCMRKYPQLRRTYARMREGTFTGGNMVLVMREFMLQNEKIIGEVYSQRKNVLKLARIIGIRVLARAFLAQVSLPSFLSVPMLEDAVGRMLGGKVKAIPTSYPEIGEDVDKAGDLAVVRQLLTIRESRS